MKLCELKIQRGDHRADLVAILAEAGYKVHVDKRKDESAWPRDVHNNFVVVEAAQAGEGKRE